MPSVACTGSAFLQLTFGGRDNPRNKSDEHHHSHEFDKCLRYDNDRGEMERRWQHHSDREHDHVESSPLCGVSDPTIRSLIARYSYVNRNRGDVAMQIPSVEHNGRLELTWTNKNRRLLSHEDGSYEWTTAGDYRTSEVRLLHDVKTVGETLPRKDRANDNLLIRGDALHALTSLAELPEFRGTFLNKVKLVYVDPPFNTGQAFLHYDDALEHSVWLTMMRDRLLQIRELLADDGSVWLHLDDVEVHRARIVMDEVFGAQNFLTTVIWEKRYSRSNDASFSVSHDTLLVYRKSPAFVVSNRLARISDTQYSNPDGDPRGPWRGIPWDAPEVRLGLEYPITTAAGTVKVPPRGRHWSGTEENWSKIVDAGMAYFGKSGAGMPNVKKYLSEMQGLVPHTVWNHEEVGHNDGAKKEIQSLFPDVTPFATPKPEKLLERILHIASQPGDLVLDCFAGSGTTAAVAQKMGRRWAIVEWQALTIEKFTMPRLQKVVEGKDLGGISTSSTRQAVNTLPGNLTPERAQLVSAAISAVVGAGALADIDADAAKAVIKALKGYLRTREIKKTNWTGGGGFRVLDVAPSMFESDEDEIFLSGWATGEQLAEAVAAQFAFTYSPEGAFVGKRGTVRLAVVDGFVNDDFVDYLLSNLAPNELIEVYATGVDPDAQEHLKTRLPGSRLVKIPASIISSYRRANRRQTGLNWLASKPEENA
jgi:adenine-specific DNA-methyltransferase